MSVEPTGWQIAMSNKFTWKITNFTELTESSYYSRVFRIGRNRWKLLVYPVPLSLFLVFSDSENLPDGWTRSVDYSFTVVNQRTANSSLKRELRYSFSADGLIWGFGAITLEKLRKDGFLVNDTLIMEVCFNNLEAAVGEQPADISTKMLDSYVSSLGQYISKLDDEPNWCLRPPSNAQSLTLDEVEDATRSLKECLTDMFKLNMKDRLAKALGTLSRAEVGLSDSQLRSVRAFWDGFGDFTLDFLTFERDNAEFELHKLLKDKILSEMKEGHKKHITLMRLIEELMKEKEECQRKMKEICKRQEELETECAVALAELQEAKSKHMEHEMKAKDAEENKRIAEERMSRSAAAWADLKAEFA